MTLAGTRDVFETQLLDNRITASARLVQLVCFQAAAISGWWLNLKTGELLCTKAGEAPKINVGEKLALIHSEVSEALEGHRKGLMDDKLPHRKMLEVELADTIIRCFDLGGGLGLDVGGALIEKLRYNLNRADHRPENRRAEGGKAF